MTLDPVLAAAIVGAFFALQGWTLTQVVSLGRKVARLETRLDVFLPRSKTGTHED